MTPRFVLLAASVLVLICGGCHASASSPPQAVTHVAPPGTTTAGAVVDHLQSQKQILLHPVDMTAVDCARSGCAQAVATDRFTIMSFAGTGAAQRYAADRGLRQIATIVVEFAPTVPDSERDELWTAITQSVD